MVTPLKPTFFKVILKNTSKKLINAALILETTPIGQWSSQIKNLKPGCDKPITLQTALLTRTNHLISVFIQEDCQVPEWFSIVNVDFNLNTLMISYKGANHIQMKEIPKK